MIRFILDEASSLGKLPIMVDGVDKLRSYGVSLTLFYQAMGQLRQCWNEGEDQTLLTNAAQIFFAINDHQTAEYVCNRMGKQTIIVNSGGTSNSTSTGGGRVTAL